MAMPSQYIIGALNAESFCERVTPAGILAMIDGSTLLDDEELEKFMLLRINRDFMTSMCEKPSHVSKQNFKQTIAIEEQNVEEQSSAVSLIKAQS